MNLGENERIRGIAQMLKESCEPYEIRQSSSETTFNSLYDEKTTVETMMEQVDTPQLTTWPDDMLEHSPDSVLNRFSRCSIEPELIAVSQSTGIPCKPITENNSSLDLKPFMESILKSIIQIFHPFNPTLKNVDYGSSFAARYAAAMKNGSKPALDTLIDLLDLAADVLRSCEEKSTSNNELLSRTCNASSSEIQIEQNFCEINVDEDCMIDTKLEEQIIYSNITIDNVSSAEMPWPLPKPTTTNDLLSLKFVNQPREFRKRRYLSCLAHGQCPEIQANTERQRSYVTIKWDEEISSSLTQTFAHVQLVDRNRNPHHQKLILPKSARAKALDCSTNEHDSTFTKKAKSLKTVTTTSHSIVADSQDILDIKNRFILLPLDDINRLNKTLELRFKICDLPKATKVDENENEPYIMRTYKYNNDDKICWLQVCLCSLNPDGSLERISEIIHSNPIKDAYGILKPIINPSSISPKALRVSGGDLIEIPLNVFLKRNVFQIYLNDELLHPGEYQLLHGKYITFHSIPKSQVKNSDDTDCLDIKIFYDDHFDDSTPNQQKDLLLSIQIPYEKYNSDDSNSQTYLLNNTTMDFLFTRDS